MRKPLGVIFDLGDTVIEYEKGNPERATRKILEVCNNPNEISVDTIQSLAINLTEEIFNKRDNDNLEVSFKWVERLLYESLGLEFNISIDEVEKMFCKYGFNGRKTEGIDELFSLLDKNNIKYGAISNSSFDEDTLKYELGLYGLNPNFQFLISSCNYCLRKPNKIIFDLGAKKLDIDPENIWFVGDSYKYDVIGAKNAGMVPVWYNKKNKQRDNEMEGIIEIKTMDELMYILNESMLKVV